ncbi:MAG: winged helix-turn-helix domain-containing protein [Polyangiaceae bacterium]|nr:winged helix-turn-helix domain-containing protein [Polyangiaceae bacterium]
MTEVPAFHTFMSPLLEVLRESPTPLSIEEADRRILARLTLPAEVLAIPHGERGTEVEYRIAWARTWLKKAGLVTNPSVENGPSRSRVEAPARSTPERWSPR